VKTLETKQVVLLHHHLKALRLPTIGAEAEKVAARAAADNQDHLAYLLQLCELELLEREKRAAERRLKAARFPTMKTLEGFDFAARPSVNKRLVAELARCEYIDHRENVLLVGNPGTGKSHLATALAAEACARGYKVRFYRATELVTTLIEARDERSFLRLKAQLAKLDLLVLDELGYVPASKVGAELLFDVISTAYERNQHDRHHQPPVRVLDRSPRQRTAHRRDARPAHPPLPHHRDQRRQLPPPRRQDPQPPTLEPRPDAHANPP
jgi:DNA replication protein DnaC